MRKINHVLNQPKSDPSANNDYNQFNQLTKQANAHLALQQFWLAATPAVVGENSFARDRKSVV